jgi:hypothetical protein
VKLLSYRPDKGITNPPLSLLILNYILLTVVKYEYSSEGGDLFLFLK